MTIEEEVKKQGISENEFEENIGGGSPTDPNFEEPMSNGFKFDLSFLKTPTGDGSIEERIDHPLNFFKSKGLAQMIRGFEGFAGNLKLAIVDIVMGAFQFMKEKKTNA